jgi:hypothetical protein
MDANLKKLCRDLDGIILGNYMDNQNETQIVDNNLEAIGINDDLAESNNDPTGDILDILADIEYTPGIPSYTKPLTVAQKSTLNNRLVELKSIVNNKSVTDPNKQQIKQHILDKLTEVINAVNAIQTVGGKRKYKKSRKSRKTLKKRKTHKKYKARK